MRASICVPSLGTLGRRHENSQPGYGGHVFAALVGMSGVFPGARQAWTLYPSTPVTTVNDLASSKLCNPILVVLLIKA